MKDKGILFKPDMIKATLADLKTMTRRLEGLKVINENPDEWDFKGWADIDAVFEDMLDRGRAIKIKCPFQIGQKLYIKETWMKFEPNHFFRGIECAYKANTDLEGEEIRQEYIKCGYPYKWKSPLFMPKKYARIWLEVTKIKDPERLQDINHKDAISEGIINDFKYITGDPVFQFMKLWNSIYIKKPEYQWNKNPWNWPITFKRIEK